LASGRRGRTQRPSVWQVRRELVLELPFPNIDFFTLLLMTPFQILALNSISLVGQTSSSWRADLAELDTALKALEKFDHTQGEGPALVLERLVSG